MKINAPAGDVKAWCLHRDSDYVWTDMACNVVYEALDDNNGETPLFTVDEIVAMEPDEMVKRGEWTVECRMVDETWLCELSEHEGW